MNEASPLQLLSTILQSEAFSDANAAGDESLPAVMTLGQLQSPEFNNDPSELIANRFLYAGGVCLLVGPTGIGKSSFLMQLAIHLSVGRAIFDICPGGFYAGTGLRTLLVQAENDEGDLADMRDGVLQGCTDLNDIEKKQALDNIVVCTISDKVSDVFVKTIEKLLTQHGPFNLLIIDPALAYLGGESNSQRDVSHLMRELINPLLQKHHIGLILAHHTNKPLRGKEKDSWAAGDFSYLGAGSAEWVNPARAVLAIRSIGSDRVFELRAPKRGRKLRWVDADGNPTLVKYIAHSDEPGTICWHPATEEDVQTALHSTQQHKPLKCGVDDAVKCVAGKPGHNQSAYTKAMASAFNCSLTSAQNALNEAVERGLLSEQLSGRSKIYAVTKKGEIWIKK